MKNNATGNDAFIRYATCGLALWAAAIYGCVEADGDRSGLSVAVEIVVEAVVMLAAGQWLSTRAKRMDDLPMISPIVVGIALLSLVWEPIGRAAFGHGRPFELMLMFGLKNLVLAMAVFSVVPSYRRLSMLGSLFLVLFAAAISTSRTVHILVGLFGVGGVCWLVASYWENLRHRLIAADQKSRTPRGWVLAAGAAAILLIATLGVAQNQSLYRLRGFLPGSGGDGEYDPFSRSGVGDGDALVAGTDNIQSFAPIENAPFLSADGPSLYDVYNDLYEEPFTPKSTNRSIALAAQLTTAGEQRIATSQFAGRQFSTLRKQARSGQRGVGDRKSDAIFYLAGRTPLHMRLEAFDIFDGIVWHPEPVPADLPRLQLFEKAGKNWLQLAEARRAVESFTGPELHKFTNVALDTNRIPMPLHSTALHVDHLKDAQLFDWAQPGIVMMQRDKLAPLVPIHISSQVLDRRAVKRDIRMFGIGDRTYQMLPDSPLTPELRQLALTWTRGLQGWEQIEAIERHLKSEYQLDPDARPPADCDYPVADFLLSSKRGPDYQFATAAALLLRSLGYSTRVVSGFYADPDKFDERARQTPVYKDDVHFWTEIYLGVGTWATVEATPGYIVLEPPPTFIERLWSQVVAAASFVVTHSVTIGICLAFAVSIFMSRFAIADTVLTLHWKLRAKQSSRERILTTFRIIAFRLSSHGISRPSGCTPGEWFRRLPLKNSDTRDALARLAEWSNWAAFAPRELTTSNSEVIERDCRRLLGTLSRRAILQDCDVKASRRRPSRSSYFRRTTQASRPGRFVGTT